MINGIRLIKQIKDLLLEGKSEVSTHLINKNNLFDASIDIAFFSAKIIEKIKFCYSMQNADVIKINEDIVSRDEAVEKRITVFLKEKADEGIILPGSVDVMSKKLLQIINSEINNESKLLFEVGKDKMKGGDKVGKSGV